MSDALLLTAIAVGTALATGLGALPVIALGAARARSAQGVLSGVAAGVMAVAATVGLLVPAYEQGRSAAVTVAAVAGAAALVFARRSLGRRAEAKGRSAAGTRSLLVVGVLFAHSLPEGFAIGSAFASTEAGIGLFVITAIAIQNVPEGTATAAAMQPAGFSPWRQFWGAVLTSVPQVPGAISRGSQSTRSTGCYRSRSPSPAARCSRSSSSTCCRRLGAQRAPGRRGRDRAGGGRHARARPRARGVAERMRALRRLCADQPGAGATSAAPADRHAENHGRRRR